jgi:hypothetical protein
MFKYRALFGFIGSFICALALNQPSSTQAAGNVHLKLESGDLVITGDNQDNNIIVIQECCQTVVVNGRADTTVNGSSGRVEADGVSGDIKIAMNEGKDFVRVEITPGVGVIAHNLKIDTGFGDDTVELFGVTVRGNTQIHTEHGDDVILIDGVQTPNGYKRPDFKGSFSVGAGSGDDLLEFHNAIFRAPVDVNMGSGIDGVCSTEDSEFLQPNLAFFDGGPPAGFPGDGFVAPIIELPHITNFEDFPDDCSFLGGRD